MPSAGALLNKVKGRLAGGGGSLLRGGAFVFLLRVAGAGLAYVAQVFIARWLGPYEFGLFSYGWALGGILAVPATLGLQTTFLRFYPTYRTRQQDRRAAGLVRFSIIAVMVGGVGVAIAAIAVLLIRVTPIPDHFAEPLMVGAMAIPLFAYVTLWRDAGRALAAPVVAFAPREVAFNLMLILGAVAVALLGFAPTAVVALGVTIGALLLTVVVQGVLLWRRLPNEVRTAQPHNERRMWLRVSLPLILVALFNEVTARADVLLVGIYLRPDDIAIYNAASRTASLAEFVMTATMALAAGRFATLHADGDSEGLQRQLTQVVQLTVWPTVALGLALAALGPWIMALFGATFTEGAGALAILALAKVLFAARAPGTTILTMTGHQNVTAIVYGATAAVNVLLNLVLIPLAGLEGAALSALISFAGSALAIHVIVRRRLDLSAFRVLPPLPRRRGAR
ncbi:MAG: polysaccharide biosynthesis C-terminal domain-containing protein [Rhodospirillales bacterium]